MVHLSSRDSNGHCDLYIRVEDELNHENHEARVAKICKEMRDHYTKYGNMRYNGPGSIHCLDRLVEVDCSRQTVKVEANMTMNCLVEATALYGLVPSVVACERSMTVADAFANQTSESSSFAFGTFDSTVLEIEVILCGGDLVKARPDLNGNLFYGSGRPLNPVGLTTMFEISLVPRGPFVTLEFMPLSLLTMQKQIETAQPISLFSQESREMSPLSMVTQEEQRAKAAGKRASSILSMAAAKLKSALSTCPVNTSLIWAIMANMMSASSDSSVRMSLVSAVLANMLWTSTDSSVDFVEAIMFNQCPGVIIGRTCPSSCNPPLQISGRNTFMQVAKAVMAAKGDNESQICCMETTSYLFRHDYHHATQIQEWHSIDHPRTSREDLDMAKQPMSQMISVCSDAIESLVQELQADCNASPPWIYPVLSPRKLGRKPIHDFDSAVHSSHDMYFTLGTRRIAAPSSCEESNQSTKKGLGVLHHHAPYPVSSTPKVSFDNVVHCDMREDWKTGFLTDVREQRASEYYSSQALRKGYVPCSGTSAFTIHSEENTPALSRLERLKRKLVSKQSKGFLTKAVTPGRTHS